MTQDKKRGWWDLLTRNEKRVFINLIISAGLLFAIGLGLEFWEDLAGYERQGLASLVMVLPMVFWWSGIAIGYLAVGWLIGVGEERRKWVEEAETGPSTGSPASQEPK